MSTLASRLSLRAAWFVCAVLGSAQSSSAAAQTDIRTDGSWGRAPATLAPAARDITVNGNLGDYRIPGNVYAIAQKQGRVAGANLFHSFERFSVGVGDAAVFTTSDAGLRNVISRVSGTSPTQINGLLALLAPINSAPNFFFINPAGVTFGAGAQIDVPAAFHVSTANGLRFADSTVFKAGEGPDSTLTVAPPEAFGFLGTTRAAIAVTGGTTLTTVPGHSVTVAGGDVEIDQAILATVGGGDVRVAAVGPGPSSVPLTGSSPTLNGRLEVVNDASILTLSVGERGGGDIVLSAGNILAAFANIMSVVTSGSAADGGRIVISAAGDLSLLGGGQVISLVDVEAYGNGGSITVSAATMTVDALRGPYLTGLMSSAQDRSAGNSGLVQLHVTDAIRVVNGGTITSDAAGNGDGGTLRIEAGSMVVDGQGSGRTTGVSSRVTAGTGSAGDVSLTVRGSVSVVDGGEVGSWTAAAGDAGTVRVNAKRLTIDGKTTERFTGLYAQALADTGRAGDLTIDVDTQLSVLSGGNISSQSFSAGAAGSVRVKAASLVIDGQGNPQNTGIASQAALGSSSSAGNIEVVVSGHVTLIDGGLVDSSTYSGDAGSISISAGSITIDRRAGLLFTGIVAGARPGSEGDAGNVVVSVAGLLSVAGGGGIVSNTAAVSDAGFVQVTAGHLSIDGGDHPLYASGIQAASLLGATGDAGSIDVRVLGSLMLVNGGVISSITSSPGDAGRVEVHAGSIVLDGRGAARATGITTQADRESSGRAGRVEVAAVGELSVRRGSVISSSTFSGGDAGSVTVSAGTALLDGEGTRILTGIFSESAVPGSGKGGRVEVSVAGALSVLNDATISSSSLSAYDAGDVIVSTLANLSLSNGGKIESSTASSGNAGSVTVHAYSIGIDGGGNPLTNTGILALASPDSSGNGGAIRVAVADRLLIANGGLIASITNSQGDAGSVHVDAGRLLIEGPGPELLTGITTGTLGGSGDAGDVEVTVEGDLSIAFAEISSNAIHSTGSAGSVQVSAEAIEIVGQRAGIAAVAEAGAGNAGNVRVSARGLLSLTQGADITASTFSADGRSGSITVDAGTLLVRGAGSAISAIAGQGSSGQTGAVEVSAAQSITLSAGAVLSIQNDAEPRNPAGLTPTRLSVSAPIIVLEDAQITAQSTGTVAASDIRIDFTDRLMVDPSFITTSAEEGDGGDMRAKSTAELLVDLGVAASFSRPRVSNDNPFSEAQFKT